MNNAHLRFHHFGLAVRHPNSAKQFLSALGYEFGTPVFDPGQNVNLAMCVHAVEPAVEVIWPGENPGPLDKLNARHASGIVYHVCYETDNLSAALEQLAASGLNPICISQPRPAPLFGGCPVSFYNIVGIGLIEIVETNVRPAA